MNYKMIGKYISEILFIEALVMIPALCISTFEKNAKAIAALLDIDTLKASKNQKEDIAAALKELAEAEDSKMLFGEPEPNVVGTGNPIGTVDKKNPAETGNLRDALSAKYGK